MNQKTIKAKLQNEKEHDFLSFEFDDQILQFDLNSDNCQSQIKDVFVNIAKLLFMNDVIVELIDIDESSSGLHKDVAREYIKLLNNEIAKVREKIIEMEE